jgi:hypothetical protein
MEEMLTTIASVYGLLIGATFTCEIVHWRRNHTRLKAKTLRLPDKELGDLFGVQFDKVRSK